MIAGLQRKAADAARRGALGAASALALCVGIGFLTAAAWIYLAQIADALTAATIIGAVYLGLGFILLGFASRKSGPYVAEPAPAPPAGAAPRTARGAGRDVPPLIQSFIFGLQAGLETRSKK